MMPYLRSHIGVKLEGIAEVLYLIEYAYVYAVPCRKRFGADSSISRYLLRGERLSEVLWVGLFPAYSLTGATASKLPLRPLFMRKDWTGAF